MKIIFFGGRHVHDIASQLKESFDLKLVITTDWSMVNYCRREKIPYAQILNFNEKLTSEIEKLKPDIGVIADFGIIIPKEIIDLFPHGILNVHPSLLPKYRGPSPVQSTILNGDKLTGITVIKTDDLLDHGPILFQEEHEIKANAYTDQLLAHLFKRSSVILPNIIRDYVARKINAISQDDSKATFTKILKKEDGYVDIDESPETRKLKRMINALSPWPGVWTRYTLTSQKSLKTLIKLLPGEQIQVEGKRPMSYKDFANGYEKGKFFLEKLSLI